MELTLKQVAERLDGNGIPWAVFAGAAAAVYGSQRPTTDIDILVATADIDRVADLFPEAVVRCCEDEHTGLFLPGFDIIGGLALMDLDRRMQERLTRHRVHGIAVPIIPPEDNILLKAIWGRGPEQGKHDMDDVTAMLARQASLDWDYLRWRASTLPPGIDAKAILAHLQSLRAGLADSEHVVNQTGTSSRPAPSMSTSGGSPNPESRS